ncbi:MAG: glycoside hydrolase family 13 protein [Prolixibacteraceae bacterium]|jgi:glycosidase|nr:glycoside hydrolase family 13 protein [Prolixibacteraceae bacterium]
MKTILTSAIALLFVMATFANSINRIDPPNWWIGFENTKLQLMVYGDNISDLNPTINYKGVSIFSVTKAQSPNYLFIDLKIDEKAKPGSFDIDFEKEGKVAATYNYSLHSREDGSALREGFDNSDVMYLLFPDRFSNGDPTNDSKEELTDKLNREDLFGRHGGDVKGIKDRLDYIQELGITAIWTTPLLEDNQPHGSYHHYATTDFYEIDARFGSNEEYKNLIDACHKRNIKVIMDMIPNHCGSAHPWMKDLPFNDWINGGTNYTQTNYRIATTNDPYVSKADADLNSNGWFVREMPDLNQKNPFMLTYLKQFAIWWIEYSGLDGIRVDTYVYNDPWKAAEWTKAITAEYPNINIVGECWQHSAAEVAYWQSGTQNYNGYDSGLPSVMDFYLHDAVSVAFNEDEQGWDGGVGKLWNNLAQDYLYANPFNLVIFLENHDTQRFTTQVGNDLDKYKLAMTFLLTTRGIPQLYYGSEILMGGDKGVGDGDIRREMPGGWSDHDRSVFTSNGRTDDENEVFNFIKKLIHWRNQNSVIHKGKLLHFIPQNNVYTYFRINDEKTVMVVLNNHKEEQTIDPSRFNQGISNFTSGIDVLSGKTINLTETFNVKGKTALVLELKD